MKNFEESLTYLCEKYIKTLEDIDFYQSKHAEAVKNLDKLRLAIKVWKPKSN